MTLFVVVLGVLGVVCLLLFFYTRSVVPLIAPDDAFYRFQRTYLCVYLLATGQFYRTDALYKSRVSNDLMSSAF